MHAALEPEVETEKDEDDLKASSTKQRSELVSLWLQSYVWQQDSGAFFAGGQRPWLLQICFWDSIHVDLVHLQKAMSQYLRLTR